MNTNQAPLRCFITGMNATNQYSELDRAQYSVTYMKIPLNFAFEPNHKNSQFVNENLHILRGLIANKIFIPNKEEILNNCGLESIISSNIFLPQSKQETLEHLLILLNKLKSPFDDVVFFSNRHNRFKDFIVKGYLKNIQQGISYFRELRSLGYLKYKLRYKSGTYKISTVFITPLGIEKISSLNCSKKFNIPHL